MKYFAVVLSVVLISPSITSPEIFELVHEYGLQGDDIASGDFNEDGLLDFIILDYVGVDSSHFEVFLLQGDFSFTRINPVNIDTAFIYSQVVAGDFNEDSLDDLLIISLNETKLFSSNGDGSFTLDEVYPWSYLNGCTGDVNDDGHLDYLGIPFEYAQPWSDSVVVMLGDGAGGFIQGWVFNETDYFGSSCHLGYFEGPGDSTVDLCIPGEFPYAGILTFIGNNDGTFSNSKYCGIDISQTIDPFFFSTSGDFNEDGYNDIAVAGCVGMSTNSTYIFLNQQDSTFEKSYFSYFPGVGYVAKISSSDINLDGYLDILLASWGGSISGNGDGTFDEILSYYPEEDFVLFDMDNDGDLDLADCWGRIYKNTTINTSIEESSESLSEINLQASPNPFSSIVNFSVQDPAQDIGTLQIFDLSGRMIQEITPNLTEGSAVCIWNGTSSSGHVLPSGIYTARLASGEITSGVMLLKLE